MRESAERLALLEAAFAAAPDGVIVADPEGRAAYWNRAFLEMWGLSDAVMRQPRAEQRRAAAAGLVRDPAAFMAEADAVRVDPHVVMHRLIELADGRVLEMHSRPLELGDGRRGRIWHYRDVTELVRARGELEEAARLLEAQFEGAPFGIVVVGMDGRLIRASRRFFELSGLDVSWTRLPIPERMARLEGLAKDPDRAKAFNARWRSSPGQQYAEVFETTDGRHVKVTTQPLLDASGEVLGQVFFYDNVTAETQARAALEEQERRLHRLVDSLDAGVMVVDRERRFRLANPAALRILGLTAEALDALALGAEAWQASRPDGTPMPFDEFPAEAALRTGQQVRGTAMGVARPDGTRSWLMVSAAPFETGADGLPASVVATFTDVTQVREAEAALARARHLESLAALAAGVAHRLNNHLTAILGNAWLIGLGGGLSDEQRESLEEIRLVADQAAALVRDLRAFAATGSGVPAETDVSACVQAALARFGPADRERLSVVLGTGLPRVVAEADGLAQALAHLIDNALEAGPGTVEVRSTVLESAQLRPRRPVRWEPAEPPPGRYAAVFVEDCGSGIPESDLGRVFEPFVTTRFEGRGLGLAAALGIVRKTGGFVGLESAPGRGTLAMVLLPLRE